jgi:hypothetical protein
VVGLSLLEKTHPPGSQNLSLEIFFHFSTLQVPKETIYIYQKLDTNSCFAKLRAIANLFSFFYTPCIVGHSGGAMQLNRLTK